MSAWLSANSGTIVICLILAAIITAVIVTMVRNRKKGKSSCGCECSRCSMNDSCNPKNLHK